MHKFLILLLAVRLTTADKIGQAYLPPPGAKLSGGNPEELQVPLEYPKETLRTSTEPLQTGITTTNEPKLQETTTITSYIPSTQIIPVFEKKYQNSDYIIHESPIRSGLISNQLNIESDFYPNQRPDNLEFIIHTGIQPKLDLNQYQKHLDAPYDQKLLSATTRQEDIIPDLKIDTTTKGPHINIPETSLSRKNHQVYFNNKLPNGQSGLLVYGQNINGDGYKSFDKDFHNTSQRIPVLITSSTGYSNKLSPTSSMPEIDKQNIDSRKIISNRPQRLEAIADRSSIILNYKNVITPMEFAYSFDSSNGIHADENGTTADGVQAQGSYAYTGDDGKVYSVIYTADKNGFQPRGDHLPTPPPLPKFIQRLIEETARDKDIGNSDDGSYDDAKYGYKKYEGAMEHYSPEMQGISLEDMKHIGSKRKIFSHRRFTISDKSSSKYEDNTINQNSGLENTEPDLYIKHLSTHSIDKLTENNKPSVKFDTNRKTSMMKNRLPVSKAYTNDAKQLLYSFKVSDIGGIQDNKKIQHEYKYLNEKSEMDKNIPRDENKQYSYNIYSAPIEKLNDDQTNLYLGNSEVNGPLVTDYPSMHKYLNSGYNYENPEIQFSYEFEKKPLKGDRQNNTYTENITFDNSSYKVATTQPDDKEYFKNTNNFGKESTNQNVYENSSVTRIPVFIKTTKTSISQRPRVTDTPYQQYTQHGRNFIPEEELTFVQNSDNSYFENLNGSGYFFVPPSTTPMPSQSTTHYIKTEPSTLEIYSTTVRPRTDYFDETKATEYPVDAIKPNTIPQSYEISQGFEISTENVVVDGFGRPITTSQPYEEFTGYVYGPGYSTTIEIDDIVPNLPSNNINQDDSEVSEIHSVSDMSKSPYDVINNFLNQEERLKENGNLDGPAFGDRSTIEFVENHSITEKIIGEEFNGPKQPQSYHPETGYRYK